MDKLCALLKHHKDVAPLTGIQCFLIHLEGEADSFCVIWPSPHRMRGTSVLRRQPPLMLSPLCTSSLVVNLWSYVTKVSLAAGLSSSPVPFLRIRPTSSSPLAGEVVMCMCAGSRGKSLVSRLSVSSEQSELIRRVGQMKYSAHYCQAGSQETQRCVFCSVCFTNPLSRENPMSTDARLRQSPASHSCRQNTVIYCCWLNSSTGALKVE